MSRWVVEAEADGNQVVFYGKLYTESAPLLYGFPMASDSRRIAAAFAYDPAEIERVRDSAERWVRGANAALAYVERFRKERSD